MLHTGKHVGAGAHEPVGPVEDGAPFLIWVGPACSHNGLNKMICMGKICSNYQCMVYTFVVSN